MTNDFTPEELTALRTYATLTAPIPKGWFEITRENSDGFDLDEIAYGLAYTDSATDEVDWAVWLRWDGWPVVYDNENCVGGDLPFCVCPPEALLRVLSEGSRAILSRLEQQQGQQ